MGEPEAELLRFSYGAFPWRRLRDLFQNRYRAMVLMRQFMALLDSERMTR